jgi:hypothetical protein
MYLFSILISIIFSAIIQAIRYSTPSRALGIFVVIFCLVIQLCAGGGLFPTSTQNDF